MAALPVKARRVSGAAQWGSYSSSRGVPQFPCLLTGNSVNAMSELQEFGPVLGSQSERD